MPRLACAGYDDFVWSDRALHRQIASDQRHEENGEVDGKSDVPQDRTKPRAIAQIGQDIGDPHNQKKHRQFVDQVLRRGAKFRQQHSGRKEWKGLDPVLMRAQRAGAKRVLEENRVARSRIVVAAKPDPLDGNDREQIEHHRSENAPFGDRHGSPDTRIKGDSIEQAITLTRMARRAKPPMSCPRRRASSSRYRQLLSRIGTAYWIARRSLSSGGHSADP